MAVRSPVCSARKTTDPCVLERFLSVTMSSIWPFIINANSSSKICSHRFIILIILVSPMLYANLLIVFFFFTNAHISSDILICVSPTHKSPLTIVFHLSLNCSVY